MVEVDVELSELILEWAHTCVQWTKYDDVSVSYRLTELECSLRERGIDVCFEI